MYDYIIIGAGSAGCVLAHRLSADPNVKVLLLEAGGSDDAALVRTPGLVGLLWRTRFDWNFFTTPQARVNERQMHWPRGKVLGGSSSINYMIYIRGHRDNYDEWRALGNKGWGYDDVLPYFKRSENNCRGADAFHGDEGPLDVSDLPSNAIGNLLIQATREALGVAENRDFNGAEQEGVGRYQLTTRNGARCSTAVAYLAPARARKNLVVVSSAMATRIAVERGRAVGVSYLRNGTLTQERAAREVIVSSGAIGSPHLLLLSGIGPADELRSHGMKAVHDLPGVGKNLRDHLIAGFGFVDKAGLTGNVNPLNLLGWWGRYALTRRGPLTSQAVESGGFVRTQPGAPRPDVQLHFMSVGSEQESLDHERFLAKGRAFSLMPTLLYPKSHGQITLRSADPTQPPLIDPRYLSDEAGDDLRVLTEGVRMAQRIARVKALDFCRGRPLNPLSTAEDDATLHAEIRRRCNTLFHPVGTCKMGHDALAVVDDTLRVRGLDGLRVVDASIMPTIVGGNTNAPTIMIAEKAADMIRSACLTKRAEELVGA